jgi:alanine racemase
LTSQSFYRDSYVEVQLDAIKYNVKQLSLLLPKDKKIIAVVKANAYGHGDVYVAKAALESGAYGLAVAILDEAIKLRKAGIDAPILVMGWIRPEDAKLAAEHQLTVTVFQKEWIQQAKQYIKKEELSVHIKVDTGMGRIGIRSEEELMEVLADLDTPAFSIDGLFTHFATADEEDLLYYQKQKEIFQPLVKVFHNQVKTPTIVHADNSAASMRFPEHSFDAVRFGISMYGLYPSDYVKKENPMSLKPAFSLHSQLIHVKYVQEGESISYGRTFQTNENTWVGTIPLGYADGWIRKLQGFEVLVEGKRMPIIGRICMDQFMIQLDKPYPIGTKVTLIGTQQEEEISVDEVANRLDTINYEIPCMISSRVPRVFVENETIIGLENKILE